MGKTFVIFTATVNNSAVIMRFVALVLIIAVVLCAYNAEAGKSRPNCRRNRNGDFVVNCDNKPTLKKRRNCKRVQLQVCPKGNVAFRNPKIGGPDFNPASAPGFYS